MRLGRGDWRMWIINVQNNLNAMGFHAMHGLLNCSSSLIHRYELIYAMMMKPDDNVRWIFRE